MDWPGTPDTAGSDASAAPSPPPSMWPGTPDEPSEPPSTSATSAMAAPSPWPGTPAEAPAPTTAHPAPEGEPAGILSTFGSQAAKAAIGLPGEVLKGVGVGLGALDSSEPIASGAMYRLGDAMSKYADTWGADEASQAAHPIASAAGSTVGGFAGATPALLASVAGAPAAATLALATGTIGAFAAAGAGNTFSEALLKGADENTAAQAAGLNAIVAGGLGAIPLGAMLSPIRAYAPELTGWAANTLEKALVSGTVFATIGEAQEFLGRKIAQNFYDPDTGYSPDIYRVLGSLIGGGVIGTVTPRMLHRIEVDGTPLTDQAIQAAAAGVTRPIEHKAKVLTDVASQMPAPVVAADEAAKRVGEEPPKISPLVTEATGVASAPKPEDGWLAYHGSAADFEAFDPKFIGTGEGGVSPGTAFEGGTFGWGAAYVGENKATGADYQNRMGGYRYKGQAYDASNPEHMASFLINYMKGSRENAIQFADEQTAKGTIGPGYAKAADIYAKASAVLSSDAVIAPLDRIGNLYSVKVTRPKDHFIEWDKPFNEQSPYVQKVIEKHPNSMVNSLAQTSSSMGEFYRRLSALDRPEGGRLEPRGASELLRDAGIAGNRYLDAGSRHAGDKVAMREGFIRDNERLRATAIETQKLSPPGSESFNRMQAIVDDYTNKIAENQKEIATLQSGEGLTYNAVVFDAKDVAVTHKNGDALKPEEKTAVDEVRAGHPVVDEDGMAIVNGKEVEGITADDMKGFAPASPVEAPPVSRTNGYDVNRRAVAEMGVTDFPDTPITAVTVGPRQIVDKLFPEGAPPGVKAAAAGADHYWRKLRKFIGLREVLAANPDWKPVQDYGINLDHMLRYAAERIIGAEDTVKAANVLPPKESAGLYALIDSYVNMRYLTPEERTKQIVRRPTDPEFAQMVRDSKVGKRGLNVFSRMVRDFEKFTSDMLGVMREKTVNLGPKAMAKENDRIDGLEKALNERPYFPVTRFGLFTVMVKGPDGPKFWRAETRREQNKIYAEVSKTLKQGESIEKGKLPESSIPLSGLPIALLDVVQKEMLAGSQHPEELRQAIEQLKYESSPVRGITSKFANKYLTPGYSKDFVRSYANFFFHGSRYLSRMRYLDLLKENLLQLRDQAGTRRDPVKANELADYFVDHYNRLMDPTTDWSMTRAFLFHMVLGFRVASAATNLTQTLISTYPHLGATFGDAKAMVAITKATAHIQNFYSRLKTMEQTGPEFRAMQELMRLGVIRGAFAPELANASEGRNLLNGYGGEAGKKLTQAVTTYMKWSSGLFEVSEQFNRRVAGMATFDLAMKNPSAKFVKDAVARDPQLYGELLVKDVPANEAAAIVAAKVMIDRTQGQYTREYRPPYMTGPLGSTIFTFKLFTHQMLGNIWNYPAAGMRMVLIMGFLGGLQGLPGFQDLNGVLKAAAYWFLGKDFDLEDEARKFAVDVLGMKGEKGLFDDPFTITKGLASRGYGIPALLDSVGEWSGVGKVPIPEMDRSAAVSLGNILPIDFGQLTANVRKDPATAWANAVSRGMGALGSYAYNVYKAIANVRDDPAEFKRWEKVEPTFLANISHAARIYQEGAERSGTGAAIARFDPHDSEHMVEMIAMGLGYQSARVSREWTRLRAENEAKVFWEMKQKMLMNQLWSAVRTQNDEDKQRVLKAIRNFNDEVVDTDGRGYALSADKLIRSMQQRATNLAKQEAGVPAKTEEIPVVQGVRRLFPSAVINTRPE